MQCQPNVFEVGQNAFSTELMWVDEPVLRDELRVQLSEEILGRNENEQKQSISA
ncbi:MAG: hypothetical protein AB7E95_09010 [Kiritimatiellales bacterium]